MPMEENNPDGSRVVAMLEKLMQQQEDLLRRFDRVEKLAPGAIVDIEIDLLPIGWSFQPGQQLRFVISARNLSGNIMPGIVEYVGANSGQHVIHTGGEHASYIQLPIKAA